jgi:type VI secretion system protein ImpC
MDQQSTGQSQWERPPRVSLTVGGKELPFVFAVLADLSGHSQLQLPPMAYRKFIRIDSDNFEEVMRHVGPRLLLELKSRLHPKNPTFQVDLHFNCLADFGPGGIARQIPGLQNRMRSSDEEAAALLDAILHDPQFQKLEATWRGLQYLVSHLDIGDSLRVEVLNVSKEDLRGDAEDFRSYEDSDLFRHIFLEAWGCFGGVPYGALIGDFEFGPGAEEVRVFRVIAETAAAVHIPFIASVSLGVFGRPDAQAAPDPEALKTLSTGDEWSLWQEFRSRDEARFVYLVLPRILLRPPYGDRTSPVREFPYEEQIGDDTSDLLWGSAAYALGVRLGKAFRVYGWFSRITGLEAGGHVEDLPLRISFADSGASVKCPTEYAIDEHLGRNLLAQGFFPLVSAERRPIVAFSTPVSCLRSSGTGDPQPRVADVSSRLPHVLAVSRFVHHLMVLMRDGSPFRSPDDLAASLNNWLADYVSDQETADEKFKARYPLRESWIEVKESKDKPGEFIAVVVLHPRFQMDEFESSARVTIDLPIPEYAFRMNAETS